MTIYKGKDAKVEHGGTPVVVGQVSGFTVDTSIMLEDSTVCGDAAVGRTETLVDWSATLETFMDGADAGQSPMVDGFRADFTFYPEGDASGRTKLSGPGIVESSSIGVTAAGLVTRSYQIQGAGPAGIVIEAITP